MPHQVSPGVSFLLYHICEDELFFENTLYDTFVLGRLLLLTKTTRGDWWIVTQHKSNFTITFLDKRLRAYCGSESVIKAAVVGVGKQNCSCLAMEEVLHVLLLPFNQQRQLTFGSLPFIIATVYISFFKQIVTGWKSIVPQIKIVCQGRRKWIWHATLIDML